MIFWIVPSSYFVDGITFLWFNIVLLPPKFYTSHLNKKVRFSANIFPRDLSNCRHTATLALADVKEAICTVEAGFLRGLAECHMACTWSDLYRSTSPGELHNFSDWESVESKVFRDGYVTFSSAMSINFFSEIPRNLLCLCRHTHPKQSSDFDSSSFFQLYVEPNPVWLSTK